MTLDPQQERLLLGALLHDVGKFVIRSRRSGEEKDHSSPIFLPLPPFGPEMLMPYPLEQIDLGEVRGCFTRIVGGRLGDRMPEIPESVLPQASLVVRGRHWANDHKISMVRSPWRPLG